MDGNLQYGSESSGPATAMPKGISIDRNFGDADDRLAHQQALLEGIVDSLPVGLHVVDRNYDIVAWNRNREDSIYGIKRIDAIGKSIFDVLRKQPREKIQEEFERVFDTGVIERVEAATSIGGVRRHFLISKIPMKLGGSKISHVITVAEDITDRKQMMEQAAVSEKLAAIGQLAAGVVHEINNPLATIAICAEALTGRLKEVSGLPDDIRDAFQEYLTIIESEAYRCKKITNSLLDFSRAQTSSKECLDINLVIDQTLFLLKHSKQLRNVILECDFQTDLELIWGNDGQLKQAFIALIINACDAMDHDGKLSAKSFQVIADNHKRIVVEFTDNGCGISPENMSKIFEPFFTTKAPGSGTGLGLSICYGIITEHGGEITVESKPGSGSTFRISFPVAKEPDEHQRQMASMEGYTS
jgi:two-component system NtrC family sensor kinase